jgi:ribonuclease R
MTEKSKKSKQKELAGRTPKEQKLFDNLFKITQQFMGGKSFVPLSRTELVERLSLPPQHEALFQEVLDALVQKGFIEQFDHRYSWKPSKRDIMTGTLRLHPRGFGFVIPDDKKEYPQDIFIPKHLTNNAIDGDHVEVLINEEALSDKGPEGKIMTILSRTRTHLAGIVRYVARNGDLIVHAPLLGTQQRVVVEPSKERSLKAGDRIVMEVIDWGSKETETVCRFSHYLGHISDPSCDVGVAIEEFELRGSFPQAAVQEAKSFGRAVPASEIKKREDLRQVTTVTIDPDTAKDFDDALSLSKDSQGHYHLGVHIADVSHYVHPSTALDAEAKERCNSTYFPNFCLPMLPGELSENLCSLKPGVNRLTVSVMMEFNRLGELIDYRIARSVIKSSKRFTYREAKQILDEKKKSPHAPLLKLMVELCRLLKGKRYERGSIEFALPELVILVDDQGVPSGTDYVSYDITHQMVEEFMLKANELVATHLSEQNRNLAYRVHDVPSEENLRDFALLAGAFGFRIPDSPTPQDLQKLFEEAGESPYANYLATSYIRRMRLAAYSPENIGHYGLSLTHYCHFTSPIRRYADLVVHRILFGESDDFDYLREVTLKCSEHERISAKAEASVTLLKKLRLLGKMKKEDPFREYPAIITRVRNFGIYFEIIDLMLEGFIHVSNLEEDFYFYDESRMRLCGQHYGETYSPGDQLTVVLLDVDLIAQEAKWDLEGPHHEYFPKPTGKRQNKPPKPLSKKQKKSSKKQNAKPPKSRKKKK